MSKELRLLVGWILFLVLVYGSLGSLVWGFGNGPMLAMASIPLWMILVVLVFGSSYTTGGLKLDSTPQKIYAEALDTRVGQYRPIGQVPKEYQGAYR